MVGRKILVCGKSKADLAALLRLLATEVEEGAENMNVASIDGLLRIMRATKNGEKDFYLDSRDLP